MTPALAWVFLPMAAGMGALHALEPGHAKTLTAAYLIGNRLAWLSRHAPAISAGMVLLSGLIALIFSLLHTPAPSPL